MGSTIPYNHQKTGVLTTAQMLNPTSNTTIDQCFCVLFVSFSGSRNLIHKSLHGCSVPHFWLSNLHWLMSVVFFCSRRSMSLKMSAQWVMQMPRRRGYISGFGIWPSISWGTQFWAIAPWTPWPQGLHFFFLDMVPLNGFWTYGLRFGFREIDSKPLPDPLNHWFNSIFDGSQQWCIHIYTHSYSTYLYIFLHIHTYVYIFIHIFTYLYIFKHIHTYLYIACVYIYIYVHIYIYSNHFGSLVIHEATTSSLYIALVYFNVVHENC